VRGRGPIRLRHFPDAFSGKTFEKVREGFSGPRMACRGHDLEERFQ
jgi:hypothetical protein